MGGPFRSELWLRGRIIWLWLLRVFKTSFLGVQERIFWVWWLRVLKKLFWVHGKNLMSLSIVFLLLPLVVGR